MMINVKTAPKKFEPKIIEITLDTFEELKAMRESLKRPGYLTTYGAATPEGSLFTIVNELYKQALEAGEVSCDF